MERITRHVPDVPASLLRQERAGGGTTPTAGRPVRDVDSRPHRIVVTTPFFEPGYKGGGPIKSVAEILDRLDGSVSCLLITADRDLGDTRPYPGLSGGLVRRGRHEILYLDRTDPRHWLRALGLTRRARPDVLYLNSLWSPPFTVLPVVAAALRLIRPSRILIAPRGELSPGALAIKHTKKRLFLVGWSLLLRALRTTFHASTDLEEAHITAAMPWSRSVVQIDSSGPPASVEPLPAGATARFVFLSRISRKKNLCLAIEALAGVPVPVTLDVYGPVEDPALWAECTQLIDRLPATVSVRHRGELAPAAVAGTLARYDAFVFPTLGENFGHVIAESLAAGCPVICSDQTPWSRVLQDGGGAVVDSFEPQEWTRVLTSWAERTPDDRSRAKARTLDAYSRWRRLADTDLAVDDFLTGSPRPGGLVRPPR